MGKVLTAMRILFIIASVLLAACSPGAIINPVSTPPKLTVTGWVGYMPQAIIDAFSAETGVSVEYIGYDTPEEALIGLEQGANYDLMIMVNSFVPDLIAAGKLAPLNYANIPNARNISPNFRDLIFDPGGRYSIVYQWGTTGLLVRTDLVERPITRWADLWDPELTGKIVLWPIPRDTVNVLLKSLGYSINTTDPNQLALARERAAELARRVTLTQEGDEVVTPYLLSDEHVVALGWTYDAFDAQAQNENIAYIIPAEGAILWFDNFVIPVASSNKALAERFIDFVLRPDMSALVTNELAVATGNEVASPLIDPELRNNPAIFPSGDALQNAEIELSLDPTTQAIHNEIYAAFMSAKP